MTETILQKLLEVESTYQITILFAIESGSRAWGFPSPDSDYDVRFVYRHPLNWYLSLDEQKDTIEVMEGDLDLVGWDLRKALRLLRKSNASVFEKLQSPILYLQRTSALEELQVMAPDYFSCRAGLHHYLSMAFNYYKACAAEETVKLKSYFYLMRTALASLWIVQKSSNPPMQFRELLPLVQDQNLLNKINQLLQLKQTVEEQYRHPREQELEAFLLSILQYCESKTDTLTKGQGTTLALDEFFRKTILSDDTPTGRSM